MACRKPSIALTISAFVAGLLLFSTPARSQQSNAITITSMTGASVVSLPVDGQGVPTLYGGVAGDPTPCNGVAANSVCNNCVNVDEACNTTRVHANLQFRINFTVSGNISGSAYLGYNENGTAQVLPGSTGSGIIGPNGSGYVIGTWGVLCDIAFNGNSNCDGSDPAFSGNIGALTLYVHVGNGDFAEANRTSVTVNLINPAGDVVDFNYTFWITDASPSGGLSTFRAHPGDEKAYIKDLSFTSCPNLSGATVKKVRVFHSPTSFAEASYPAYNSGRSDDFNLDANCDPVGDWVVEGLENGVTYFFRAALIDQANNAVFINRLVGGVDTVGTCGANTDLGCDMISTPDNVFGLLPEDFNCFIATAAYGSPFAQKVQTFRDFRDKYLKPSYLGQMFIDLYYAYSPRIARFISESPLWKQIARVGLLPLWAFAEVSLTFGLGWAFAVAAVLLTVFYLMWGRLRRKHP